MGSTVPVPGPRTPVIDAFLFLQIWIRRRRRRVDEVEVSAGQSLKTKNHKFKLILHAAKIRILAL